MDTETHSQADTIHHPEATMRDQITTHERNCNTLANLLVEHGLADRVKNNPDGITARIDLWGDQVTALLEVVEAGLLALSASHHPSNRLTYNHAVYLTPTTVNNGAAR
jgi:hypothetical protein